MTKFTTIGSVRGSCRHNHRTLNAAIDCCDRDSSACKSQGGYSDRRVFEVTDSGEKILWAPTGENKYDYEPATNA